jgi:ketosteroid isomerase-like protein
LEAAMTTEENIEFVRSFLETEDWPRLIDRLADDIVFKVTIPEGTPVSGEFRGKDAVVEHFGNLANLLEFHQETPLEYFGSGERVVVLGQETVEIKKNGVSVPQSEYADVFDFRDGLVTRFTIIQDLTAVVDAYRSD